MQRFKNILVCVDLSQGGRGGPTELSAPCREAVERALWLAKLNSAAATFFYALDVSVAKERLGGDVFGSEDTTVEEANEALDGFVAKAAEAGVAASREVRVGKSWVEIIRQVLRSEHDLVVAGTRHLSGVKSFFVGSTGIKLLRKCPCPLWIVQPQQEEAIQSVLVAHCLRPVGDTAMELGCSMAELHDAQLHVVHSLQLPELDSVFPSSISSERLEAIRTRAQEHIDAQLADYEFARKPQVHIVTDAPEFAVLEQIRKHDVELAVMGTIARTGISGFITGNTAERLLPQLPCSVLAVKPEGFVSPVSL